MPKPIRFSPHALTPKHAAKLTDLEKGNKGTYATVDDMRAAVCDLQYNHPELQGEDRERMNQLYLTVLGI